MLTILVDGIAYGMILFVLAVGLSVTLGLMNFINLAHGAFAMGGGYLTVVLMREAGVPFLLCLPLAFVAVGIAGAVLERLLYRQLYDRSHLDQILFSIGLIFVAMSAIDWFEGSQQQLIQLPSFLRGRFDLFGVSIGAYRAFVIVVCAVLVVALQLVVSRTRFGAQLRAGVDNAEVARGLGISVGWVFAITFAVGSGLAGLGGALGAELLGMTPDFPLRFIIYFLVVVAVGGTQTLIGPFVAALVLGIADVMGKYYVPGIGAFIIYTLMVAILIWRPEGLFARGSAR